MRIVPPSLVALLALGAGAPAEPPREVASVPTYGVAEITLRGPRQGPTDTPARDVELSVLFRHEDGALEHRVLGFWDGDGEGGNEGDVFRVRFTPTAPGRWTLAEVRSSEAELREQRQGDFVTAREATGPGFWMPDPESPGNRWYRRSDGSHPYIVGNTHYSFLSGMRDGGRPSGNDIARDVARNAELFRKLRFSVHGDRYVHPEVKPFLDDDGRPTDDGGFSHRPNPAWFHGRVDVAVRSALEVDLIADLILAGPDTESSRKTLKGGAREVAAYLRAMAARYGSYPNVWICIANEYDIKRPKYSEAEIARFGSILREALPYPTPLSVHASPHTWAAAFDDLPPWNDHQIIQSKLKRLDSAADAIARARTGVRKPRERPTINDELSYEGAGDGHVEGDTIEAHLGAFLGGGYGSTGYKSGNKLGHYFWGSFEPAEHTSADNLGFLRQVIDGEVTFWRMKPDASIFSNLDDGFRGLAWPGEEYVLGTNRAREGIVARLPEGRWRIVRHDIVAKRSGVLSEEASGSFRFDAPESRAVLFHVRRSTRGGTSAR